MSRIQVAPQSREGPLLGHRWPVPSPRGGRDQAALWDLVYKGANPTQGSTFLSSSPPKGPASQCLHLGVRVLTCEFWGVGWRAQTFRTKQALVEPHSTGILKVGVSWLPLGRVTWGH